MFQDEQRLSKVLAAAGIASRRSCEALIFQGRVAVNGQVVFIPQTLVSLPRDHITVNGEEVREIPRKVYYILNKPPGYTCSQERRGRKKLVLDLFEEEVDKQRLFTAGRLDRDTSGMLFVTNDGDFVYRITHPSFDIEREYLVKVQQEVDEKHLQKMSKGGFIEGSWVRPIKVEKVRKGTLKIVVKEGKKREVRLLVAKAALTLLQLTRIRIGGLALGSLELGRYRMMTEKDKAAVFHK
jgi:23S rRNA pseudouridine2605 synthase